MKITYTDNIGDTPAMVDRKTGEIFLNSNVWDQLPKPYQAFILGHEKGHYTLQTTNELEADHYAFDQIAGTFPESLKNMVKTLFDVLPYNSPAHGLRLLNAYRLALKYDFDKQPTEARLNEIRLVENDILKDFSYDPEFMEYYQLARDRGTLKDYDFPGYERRMFTPSVGQTFRDFKTETVSPSIHWPEATPVAGVPANNLPLATTEAIPLEFVPEFSAFQIDIKSVAIGVLIILAIIGLTKI